MINNTTSNSLIVLLWNCNGILNHVNELTATLHNKRIDIALISESHLTDRARINIPGYHLITSNHPDGSAHAGSAILIRTHLQFYPLPNYNKDYIQAYAISLILNHVRLTIAAAYCPPKHNITIDQFKLFFKQLGHKFIVGGDINAKHPHWGCHEVILSFVSSTLNNAKFTLHPIQHIGLHPQENVPTSLISSYLKPLTTSFITLKTSTPCTRTTQLYASLLILHPQS